MTDPLGGIGPNDTPDAVDPPHYRRLTPQPLAVATRWNFDRHLTQALKYMARAGHKTPNPCEDLRKAQRYIQLFIWLHEDPNRYWAELGEGDVQG